MPSSSTHRRSWIGIALMFPLALGLSACRGDDAGSAPGPGSNTARPAASASAASTPPAAPETFVIKEKPPAVTNLDEAKKYANTKITFYGEAIGLGAELDKMMAKAFSDQTGIQVTVIPKPKDSTEAYATYQRTFQAQSSDIDVIQLDVIWPSAFASHLVDLGPKLGEAAKEHFEAFIKNNTVDGKLVAIPFFTDFGFLYYRTDLLQKYGFSKPPETWDELEQMAKKIQDGERAQNPTFAGYVWQGKAYEGLTCNALEWFVSQGGGSIIDDGKPTLNNPKAADALRRAKGWVGTISPAGVTGYEEEDARNAFQSGNAAFMRNWPYAYSTGDNAESKIKGKFDVAPLPHQPGEKSAGTVGGWEIGVSKYSKNIDASIEFVRYMTGPGVQKLRAIVGSQIPTIRALHEDPEVLKALPFLAKVKGTSLAVRPSNATGTRYNEASIAFFQAVSQALQGKDPADVLKQAEQRIQRAMR